MESKGKKLSKRPHPLTNRLAFLFVEALFYILCFSLCAYLMKDSLLKYTRGATTNLSGWLDDIGGKWSMPYLTFCPRKGFRSLKYAFTFADYDNNSFHLDDLFESTEDLKKTFEVFVTSTALNGRCFSLKDKRMRKWREEVTIRLKRTTDLEVYVHDLLEETVIDIEKF